MQSQPPPTSSVADSVLQVEVHVWIGTERTAIFSVPPGEYLIGSDPSCHICLGAEHVERMHARLSFLGHRLLVEDLESEGGVFIGGERITLPTPVHPSTEIHIGSARLILEFSAAALSQITTELNDPSLGLEAIRGEVSQEQYQVTGTLGEGGMGVVLKARDQRVQRSVAMKVLRPGNEFSAEKLQRFVGEAQLTGQLEHPNIVPVYQLGVNAGGQVFYTMKYVRGQTLDVVIENLRRGDPETCHRYPLSELLTVFQKVADAIAFAHSHGVIHRDLKPANIMMGPFGEVLVMDWGLAKRLASSPNQPSDAGAADAFTQLPEQRRFNTLEGAVVGTPPFLSPEQTKSGLRMDHRSDIFVLGVILYEILALRPPLELHDSDQVISAIRNGRLIPIQDRIKMPEEDGGPPPKLHHCPGGNLPEGIAAIAAKAMRYLPSERYQSVEALQRDITACQNGFASSAEEAGWFRQLQLLLGRRRRESLIIFCGLVLSQILLAYFLGKIAADRKVLRASQSALAASNEELREANQRLEQIFYQLRNAAENNYRDAVSQLRQRRPTQALAQINLALVGAAESPRLKARYLIIRGHANTQLGFYSEALDDYRHSAQIAPGSVPIAEIESDISRVLDDGIRPLEGWSWEKLDIPTTSKPKASPKGTTSAATQLGSPEKPPTPQAASTPTQN